MYKFIALPIQTNANQSNSRHIQINEHTPDEFFTQLDKSNIKTLFTPVSKKNAACWVGPIDPNTPTLFFKVILSIHLEKPLDCTVLKGSDHDHPWDAIHKFPFQLKLFECTGNDVDENTAMPVGDCRFHLEAPGRSEIKWIQKGSVSTGQQSLSFINDCLRYMNIRYSLLQDAATVMKKTSLAMLKTMEAKEPFYARFGFHTMSFNQHMYAGSGYKELQSQDIAIESWAKKTIQQTPMISFLDTFQKANLPQKKSIQITKSLTNKQCQNNAPIAHVLRDYKEKSTAKEYTSLLHDFHSQINDFLQLPIAHLKAHNINRTLYLALNISYHHVFMINDRQATPTTDTTVRTPETLSNESIWTWSDVIQNSDTRPKKETSSAIQTAKRTIKISAPRQSKMYKTQVS